MHVDPDELKERLSDAVAHFWTTRSHQTASQKKRGTIDRGTRSEVTGGSQMDGFIALITQLIRNAGIPDAEVFRNRKLELPGFYRPNKKWDLLVVADSMVIAVIEAKSHVGPSFGNNFNNRAEEAIGSAVDLWTAYREGAFGNSRRPWLGYLFLLEDCDKSRTPVKVVQPHFPVLEEFRNASYMERYELLCRKLVRERHYEAAAFLTSTRQHGPNGKLDEPAADLTFASFTLSLIAGIAAFASMRDNTNNV